MMKHNVMLTLALSLLLMACLAMPGYATELPVEQPLPLLPVVQVDPEFADEYQLALAALEAHTPGAVVDYAVRERDDGRYEWDLFFTLNGQLGQAEIEEENYLVRRVRLFEMQPDSLTTADVMAVLVQEKGELVLLDLELDLDDGRLRYEGEAMQGEKRYEFEISVNGRMIDWERD